MKIESIAHEFSICKISDVAAVDITQEFCFLCKTDQEVSLVCRTKHVPQNATERDDGWKAFRVQGVLDFSLVGILAELSAVLAANQIGIFAISTYNTDYILTKSHTYDKALRVLMEAGHQVD